MVPQILGKPPQIPPVFGGFAISSLGFGGAEVESSGVSGLKFGVRNELQSKLRRGWGYTGDYLGVTRGDTRSKILLGMFLSN